MPNITKSQFSCTKNIYRVRGEIQEALLLNLHVITTRVENNSFAENKTRRLASVVLDKYQTLHITEQLSRCVSKNKRD